MYVCVRGGGGALDLLFESMDRLHVENDQCQKKPLHSGQVYSSWEKDIVSVLLSDGPGNVMNGVMGGRRNHAMQIS